MSFLNLINLFLEKGIGKEKERERNISVWLSLMHPLLGTWPTTQACALTGNWTSNPLVHRPALNPLSHTNQGTWVFFLMVHVYRESLNLVSFCCPVIFALIALLSHYGVPLWYDGRLPLLVIIYSTLSPGAWDNQNCFHILLTLLQQIFGCLLYVECRFDIRSVILNKV